MHRGLMGKPAIRRPLCRPRRRWEDNIKMDIQDAVWGKDWIDLAHNSDWWRAVVITVMNHEMRGIP